MSSNKVQEPKPMKLYTRIVLFFVLAFSILLIISFVMVFYFSQQIVLNENRSNLIKFNSYIINVIKENEEALLSLPTNSRLDFISEKIYPNVKDNTLISYKISDNYGDVYLSSEGVEDLLNQDNFSEYNIDLFKLHIDNPADQTEDNVAVDSFRYNKTEYYYLGSSYLVSDDYTIYIQVVKNLNDSFVYMTALFSIQIAISIVCLAIIIFIGIYGTKRSLKPLIEIAETAKNVTENNLNTRIKETGNDDELDQLIKSLNQMIGQLESAFDAQKQFVSDASHELRIPLTVIQGYSDILSSWGKENPQLLEESVDSINEEIQNMKKLVEELLLITRLENNYFTQKFEPADLGELVTKVYHECEMIDSTHSFELTRADHCLVKCNESLILQALRALADNSMKYTPPQGKIRFSCTEAANRCVLSVTDTGIGIPESELENVRRRFFRVDSDRSRETGGTGLGLSIIESIVKLHRGELVIESTLGQGTTMKIFLNK
ncbi:sensor histidine kinase [Eubacterium maltosivorans]|uniref:histidine kinase n=1 Tax=Eubacterium maltosivorans TaxID=2041044 RepID=A0A4P9C424_EUBML|nr:ATP-binding protein [Eubacterium maltosivorans]QCT70067.1 HAMP domain-containing protein [Eubacterium maltosivorans]